MGFCRCHQACILTFNCPISSACIDTIDADDANEIILQCSKLVQTHISTSISNNGTVASIHAYKLMLHYTIIYTKQNSSEIIYDQVCKRCFTTGN